MTKPPSAAAEPSICPHLPFGPVQCPECHHDWLAQHAAAETPAGSETPTFHGPAFGRDYRELWKLADSHVTELELQITAAQKERDKCVVRITNIPNGKTLRGREAIDYLLHACAEANGKRIDAESDLAAERGLHSELRQFHDACILDMYKILGIDGSDGELRYKWCALGINALKHKTEQAEARAAELASDIESHVQIAAELATENAALQAKIATHIVCPYCNPLALASRPAKGGQG